MDEIIKSRVYVRTDSTRRIIQCEGEYTLGNILDLSAADVHLIDEGSGDRFNLAQSLYFDGGITDDNGIYRYKLIENASSAYGFTPVMRSADEIAEDLANVPKPVPSDKDYVEFYGAALGMQWDGLKWVYDRNEPVAMLVFPFPVRPNCWYRAADGKLYVGVENAWAQSVEDECLEAFE